MGAGRACAHGPATTTTRISTRELGSAAWRRLEDKSSDGDGTKEPETVRRLPFELVVRASTATPAVPDSSAGRPRRSAADAAPPEAPVDSSKQTFSVAATAEKRRRGRDGREGAMGARPPTGGWRRRELTGRRVAPPLRTCGPCRSRIYDDEPCGSAVGGQSDERERQRPSTPATSMLRKQDRSSPAPKATRLSCRRPCPPR